MKIVCIGGGPAGLYFALLMKKSNPAHDITVVERNKPYDTFGWGVVFSDATMDNMRRCDPAMLDAARHSGFLAVIGEVGSGKTVMRRKVMSLKRVSCSSLRSMSMRSGRACPSLISPLRNASIMCGGSMSG